MQLWLPLFTIFAYVAAAAGFVRVYRKPAPVRGMRCR